MQWPRAIAAPRKMNWGPNVARMLDDSPLHHPSKRHLNSWSAQRSEGKKSSESLIKFHTVVGINCALFEVETYIDVANTRCVAESRSMGRHHKIPCGDPFARKLGALPRTCYRPSKFGQA